MRALLLLSAAVLGTGCFYPFCFGYACEPCPPDLTLTVTDATTHGDVGGVVTSVGACARQPCTLHPGAGEHALTIEAPGYVPEHIRVVILEAEPTPSEDAVGRCCAPCAIRPVSVDVQLMPLL